MDLKFGISESSFVDFRLNQYCFVDKTLFIKEVVNDDPRVTLYTRPRRFGKTLLMTMLKEFLSLSGADVFQGLKISEDLEFCKKHQNQYPVIFLSLKDCKYSKFEKMLSAMQSAISNLYLQHDYLLDSPHLRDYQKELFQRVLKKDTRDDVELADTLANLMLYLQQHTGKKVIVLLDEYDTPVHYSYMGSSATSVMEFMRSLMGQAFKDNFCLERGVITGISRVAQESLFSGLNNLKVYTVLDERHESAFGFTEAEVGALLAPDQIALMDSMREWYNGYSFGRAKIYNPWSIMNCLFSNGKIDCYWRNTADNSLIFHLISQGSKGLRSNILQLMDGESVVQHIDINLDLKYLEQDPSAVWTLLVHSGYVTAQRLHNTGQAATLRISNKEILTIFNSMVEGWFKGSPKRANTYEDFVKSISSGNVELFADSISQYIMESGSCFDFSTNTPEIVFHVFILGILLALKETHTVVSNREMGLGRADLVLIPKNISKDSVACILEFKTCGSVNQLEHKAIEALDQIRVRKCSTPLAGSVIAIGMAFCGKQMRYRYEKQSIPNSL